MKLIEMKCKNCGAKLKVNPDDKEANCQFCGAIFKIDDEVQHHKIDDAEQIGYEMEKGKIRAREEAMQEKIYEQNALLEAQYEEEKKKKTLIWWIIGWIFCFPIPLTILIWKSKWDKQKKTIATIILWIVILILGLLTPNETTNTINNKESEKSKNLISINETFINKYNAIGTAKIENIKTYNAQDRNSGYYRTEFRLNAFHNNDSIHGTIEGGTIDLINYGSSNKKDEFRLYATVENEEIMKTVFKNSINIIDNSITDNEINEEITEAIQTKDNRFVLKGNVEGGYIMIAKGKWEILIDSNIKFAK